jgi:hypothetical protein
MRRLTRLVVALGVLVVQGPLIGTITEASQTPTAVDIDVDDINHVITITGRITLYPLCAPRVRASPSFRGADGAPMPSSPCTVPEAVRQQVQDQIEQVWNQGKKFECYDVVVKAIVTVDNSASQFTTSSDSVMIGLDQGATTFDSHVHGGPFQSGHTNNGDRAEDRFVPVNSSDRPSRWAHPPVGNNGQTVNVYAHEFGHVMGLDDSYEYVTDAQGNRVRQLRAGMADDLMNTSYNSNIDQSTIDRLIERSGKITKATAKCDYKIDQTIEWYHFTSVKCDTPEGDWVLTVDGTRDIGGGVIFVLTGSGLITLTDNGTAITGPWDAQYNVSVEGIPVSIGGQNAQLSGDAEFVKPNTLTLVPTSASGDFYSSNPYASLAGPIGDPSKPITFTVINDAFC